MEILLKKKENDFNPGEKHKLPGIRQVSILYSISVILLTFFGSRAQRNDFYSGILITEFVLILLPPLAMLFSGKYDMKETLRLNRIGFLKLFLIFWIVIFAIPLVNSLNQLYLLAIKYLFGSVRTATVPPATTSSGLVVNILVIGVTAGFCEEILFRGVLMRGLERFGSAQAILISAFLFGLWHMYFTSFMGTFLLGALIGYIVYRTNSIYGGMFAHFVNNSMAVIASFAVNYMSKNLNISGLDETMSDIDQYFTRLLEGPASQLAFAIGTLVFAVVFFASILACLLAAFRYTTEKTVVKVRNYENSREKNGLIWLLPGLGLIGFIYFSEGLALLNVKYEWVDTVLAVLGLI